MAITQGGAIAYGNNVVTGGGSGGGSGHTILNDAGTSLAQEDDLQFVGTYVSDDSTNGKTKVNIVREFQSVAEIEALTGEAKKGFEVIEDNEEYIPYTGSDILFDNTDTSFEGENVQEVLEEVDGKMNTTKTGTLEEGTDFSTYVGTVFVAKAEEKNGVVIVNMLFTTKNVSASSGWKEIFKLPSNISKPTYDQTVSIIMDNGLWGQIQVKTDGSIPLNAGAIASGVVYSANFIYFG